MSQPEVREKRYQFQTRGKKIWFSSDTHFGHANILRFCIRPYENVEQMNEQLIENWNSIVGPNDIVFHLGDFAFGGSELFESIISRLNGKIYWVYGNHDYKNVRPKYLEYFEATAPKMVISIDGQPIILNHEPLLCFGGQDTGKYWHLFGHVHTCHSKTQGSDFNRMKNMATSTMYDVGCDFNDYKPISFEEVKRRIEYQKETGKNYIDCWL